MTGIPITPDPSALLRGPDPQLTRAEIAVTKLTALQPPANLADEGAHAADGGAVQGRPLRADTALGTAGSQAAQAGSTRESLSFAARTILNLMNGTESGPVRAQAPLLAAPPTSATAAQLPAALAATVAQSGMFYEHHLAQWVGGARPLALLRQEPQAALAQPDAPQALGAPAGPAVAQAEGRPIAMLLLPAPAPASSPAATMPLPAAAEHGADTPATSHPAAAPRDDGALPRGTQPLHQYTGALARALHAGPSSLAAQAYQDAARQAEADRLPPPRAAHYVDTGDVTAAGTDSRPAHGTASPYPIHPAGEGLVRQQLELLATQQFRWAGEAWPGTGMTWEIAHAPDDGQGAGTATMPAWSTRLVLELPTLGTVEARLSLSGTALEARIVSPDGESVSRLNHARSELTGNLSAQGLTLMRLAIDQQAIRHDDAAAENEA